MTKTDWILLSFITLGVLFLASKAKAYAGGSPGSSSAIIDRIRKANPASLPINVTDDELRVMGYAEIIMYEAHREGIEAAIIAGVTLAESSGNANAVREEPSLNDRSIGLMQLLTATADFMKSKNPWLKYNGDVGQLFRPDVNIEVGTSYLRYQLDRYMLKPTINPISDMVAAYNAGSVFVNELTYTNSRGDPKVQRYVDTVAMATFRFRMILEYLYPEYWNIFNPSFWKSFG